MCAPADAACKQILCCLQLLYKDLMTWSASSIRIAIGVCRALNPTPGLWEQVHSAALNPILLVTNQCLLLQTMLRATCNASCSSLALPTQSPAQHPYSRDAVHFVTMRRALLGP